MATAILYYSRTGATDTYCKWLAKDLNNDGEETDIFRINEVKERGMMNCVLFGTRQAAKARKSKIIRPDIDWSKYKNVVIAGPIWNGNPAPAVNSIIELLPPRKRVTLILVSKDGTHVAAYAQNKIREKRCAVTEVLSLKRTEALLEE